MLTARQAVLDILGASALVVAIGLVARGKSPGPDPVYRFAQHE